MGAVLRWRRDGDFLDSDVGGYRVLRVKMIREDRPAYFRYVSFFGKEMLNCLDSADEAKVVCVEHWGGVKHG